MSVSRHASRTSLSSKHLSASFVPQTPQSGVSYASSTGETEYFNPTDSFELSITPNHSPPDSNNDSSTETTETERADGGTWMSASPGAAVMTRVTSSDDGLDERTMGDEEDELQALEIGINGGDLTETETEASERQREEEEDRLAWWYDGLEDRREEYWNEERERGRRRVYGGGRQHEINVSGDLHWIDVAFEIVALCLPPVVYSLPYALDLLGGHSKTFIPILLIVAFGSWFTLVLISMQARYTGSLSFPGLAKSVFPYNSWLAKLGELGVELWRGLTEGGRATIAFMGASDVVQQLMKHWCPDTYIFRDRIFVVVILILALLLTPPVKSLFVPRWSSPPTHSSSTGGPRGRTHTHQRSFSNFRTLVSTTSRPLSGSLFSFKRLPTLLVLIVYSFGLLILGLRPQHMSPPTIDDPANLIAPTLLAGSDVLGGSSFGAICLAFLVFSPHPHVFSLLRSLRRTASNKRDSVGDSNMFTNPGFVRRKRLLRKLRSDRWELACLSGLSITFGLASGWAVVGWHVSGENGVRGNLFLSPYLDQGDGWMDFLRLGVVLATLSNLRRILQPTISFLQRAGWWLFTDRRQEEDGYEPISQIQKKKLGKEVKKLAWLAREVIVWASLATISIVWSGGLTSLGELVGGYGVAMNAWLTPGISAFYFIILFHVRKARSIFISPTVADRPISDGEGNESSSPTNASQDSLLLHKEHELQRRLSGRRLWQDVGVFGGVAPASIVVIIQTTVTLVASS